MKHSKNCSNITVKNLLCFCCGTVNQGTLIQCVRLNRSWMIFSVEIFIGNNPYAGIIAVV